MSGRFDLIVFDWDGTLLDSAAVIARCIIAASRDLGLAEPSEERARYVIGLGLVDSLRHAVPDLPESDYPRMSERYRHHFLASGHELTLFPGAAETVTWLAAQGRMLGVATGKSRAGLNQALQDSGLGPCFHATRCADECFSKPHPEMLEELMDELGVEPARTLMVGDTTHDLKMASNAGVAALGVSFGAHPAAMLLAESPLACVHTPAEMGLWLRTHA